MAKNTSVSGVYLSTPKNDTVLAEGDRSTIISGLNASLVMALDLYSQIRHAHWTLRSTKVSNTGDELLDRLATQLSRWANDFSDRAAMLGGYEAGAVQLDTTSSANEGYVLLAIDGDYFARTLLERYKAYSRTMRKRLLDARNIGDELTEEIYTDVVRCTELDAWLLEHHVLAELVQAKRTPAVA